MERVAPHIELKLKMGHQPFSHFKIVSYHRSISLVLAVSSTSGFHKSFPTSSACVLLRPIVSLHVHYQSALLDKLLSTFFTLKLSDSSVNLFVAHPNARQAESLSAASLPASMFPLSSVFSHVLLQAVLVVAIFLAYLASMQASHVVLVV